MGESVKCPLCGAMHPEGTTFCDVMWADIPQEQDENEPGGEIDETLCSDDAEDAQTGRCPDCGSFGITGDECWQCGSTIESCVQKSRDSYVFLHVENGPNVRMELGKTIVIGREGDSSELNRVLLEYDIVSRRHCSIHLSQDATFVTVTDNGSTNGTFVGPDAERLEKDIACTMKLPAQIRLGSCVNITLESEGRDG